MASYEENGGMMVEKKAGTLVWVRRRNGSWWPGIVISNKQLPSKLKNSRRIGTPIKLLGRPDGSIDWYNLEKTVRVKAFRCGGEYDEIIERARFYETQKHLKKYPNEGKYVRREDAILHALGIEKAQQESCASVSKTKGESSKQMNGVKKKGLSENDKQIGSKKRTKNPTDSEEELRTEGVLRMRDLREIGSKEEKNPKSKSVATHEITTNPKNKSVATHEITTNPKNKSVATHEITTNPKNTSVATHEMTNPKNTSVATHDITNPNPDLVPNPNPNLMKEINLQFGGISTTSSSNSTAKRKRSNMAQAYENMRKKHKSVPLSKLCDGSRVIIPSYCNWVGPKAFNHKENSIGYDSININKNNNNNCGQDSSETSSRSNCNGRDLDSLNGISGGGLENGSSDGFINVPLVMGDVFEGDYPSAFGSYASDKHDTSVSFEETLNPNPDINNNNGGLMQEISNNIHSYENNSNTGTSYSESTESDHDSMHAKPDSNSVSKPGNRIPDEIPAFDSRFLDSKLMPLVEEEEEEMKVVKPLKSVPMESYEYDVEIIVKTSYKGPHVPLVSLMSRLNSKAIVGHPVSVQMVKDGSTLHLLSSKEKEKEKQNHYHRPSTSSINQLLKRDEKVISGQRKRSHKKADRRKKVDSRKMRRLSSITIDRRERRGERKLLVEKMSGPTVACVPLRLVFSRINEALKFPTRLENP